VIPCNNCDGFTTIYLQDPASALSSRNKRKLHWGYVFSIVSYCVLKSICRTLVLLLTCLVFSLNSIALLFITQKICLICTIPFSNGNLVFSLSKTLIVPLHVSLFKKKTPVYLSTSICGQIRHTGFRLQFSNRYSLCC
jgi:hypothetical protein